MIHPWNLRTAIGLVETDSFQAICEHSLGDFDASGGLPKAKRDTRSVEGVPSLVATDRFVRIDELDFAGF